MIAMAMLNSTYYTNNNDQLWSHWPLADHFDTIVIAESEPCLYVYLQGVFDSPRNTYRLILIVNHFAPEKN